MVYAMMPKMGLCVVLCLTLFWALCNGMDTKADWVSSLEITSIPGFDGKFPSKHYGGYVEIDEKNGRSLYYYFIESEGNPQNDPVLLWLNGGPGCSSFDGWIYSHGPFNFVPSNQQGGLPQLTINPNSLSKVANVIYLDSPAGVGFSFSKLQTDYNTSDTKTAQDTHEFLLKWFMLFPQFQSNPLYLSGESWAGVYIPTLATQVDSGIKIGVQPMLNLKGYAVGNPWTDDVIDTNSYLPCLYGMALVSPQQYEAAQTSCNNSYVPPYTSQCYDTLVQIDESTVDINEYNILQPCFHEPSGQTSTTNLSRISELGLRNKVLKTPHRLPLDRVRSLGLEDFRTVHKSLRGSINAEQSHRVMVPCFDDSLATNWLNHEAVRSAIHAQPSSAGQPWVLCTNVLTYDHDAGSMIPLHEELTKNLGYRALLFSGDHDCNVPYIGTRQWTEGLKYSTVKAWRPWYTQQQVAGFVVAYDHDLSFATVKGAGHRVAQWKPAEFLAMIQGWLQTKEL